MNLQTTPGTNHTLRETVQLINIGDKQFEKFISENEIIERVHEIAKVINSEYEFKNPIFLPVLNGAFFFAADLLKEINISCEVSFVKVASYSGAESNGEVKSLLGISTSLQDRDVIVVEDIVDTGFTINWLTNKLKEEGARSVKVVTLLLKPDALKYPIHIDYVGFEVNNKFLIGYGLDYNQQGRNFRDIYTETDIF